MHPLPVRATACDRAASAMTDRYVIGIPAATVYTLVHGRRSNKLSDPEWLRCLGFLFRRYREYSFTLFVPHPLSPQ